MTRKIGDLEPVEDVVKWLDQQADSVAVGEYGHRLLSAFRAQLIAALDAAVIRKPAPKASRSGIYIVRAEHGQIKIGYAVSIDRRLGQLRTMSPVPLTLVAVLEGADRQHEQALHMRFRASRLHGEWFEETDEIRTFLQTEVLTS